MPRTGGNAGKSTRKLMLLMRLGKPTWPVIDGFAAPGSRL
jgi:hypothetical protein